MFNLNYTTKEDIKEHNPQWPEIPDHPYRILIVKGSGSGKTNALLNLINNPNAKNLHEAKYQLLINKIESTILKYLYNLKDFIEHSTYIEYNPNKKRKILIVLLTINDSLFTINEKCSHSIS